MKSAYAYPQLPRTGLCNMLFPWARAVLFARDNALEILAPEWVKINRIGPWLRRERDKRYYFNDFLNQGYVNGLKKLWVLLFKRSTVVNFSGMGNYFADIMSESEYLKKALYRIVNPKIREQLSKLPQNYIGVHIRRGDFTRIGLSLNNEYYLAAIRKAIEVDGAATSGGVLVFSDAKEEELGYLDELRYEGVDVRIMPPAPAVQDLLSLSRARIIVATNRSTFSAWAVFLGRVPSIWSEAGEAPSLDKEIYPTILV